MNANVGQCYVFQKLKRNTGIPADTYIHILYIFNYFVLLALMP